MPLQPLSLLSFCETRAACSRPANLHVTSPCRSAGPVASSGPGGARDKERKEGSRRGANVFLSSLTIGPLLGFFSRERGHCRRVRGAMFILHGYVSLRDTRFLLILWSLFVSLCVILYAASLVRASLFESYIVRNRDYCLSRPLFSGTVHHSSTFPLFHVKFHVILFLFVAKYVRKSSDDFTWIQILENTLATVVPLYVSYNDTVTYDNTRGQ